MVARQIIETDLVTVTHGPHSEETALPPGEYSCLRVIDTEKECRMLSERGSLSPSSQRKEVGKGTGLGFRLFMGIVSQFGGSISVDSAPEKEHG